MPHHRSWAYLSSSGQSRAGRRTFRTAELNAAGWAAVAGLCATGAATGWAVARLTNASPRITVPAGGAAAFAAVLAADRRKWAGMSTSYGWTDNPAEVQHMATVLELAGVDVSADTEESRRPTLRYLNRDHRRVARAFRNAGLRPPPRN